MLEAQDEQAHLHLGDRMFCQLAIRVQQLVPVAIKVANEAVHESCGINAYLEAPHPELRREMQQQHQTLTEV